jgi:serine/threonine-protein kinase
LILEARAAAKIRSEHVARVLDVGTLPSGAPYIVMEYLEGRDLATMLEQSGPLPVIQAVDFLLEACEALAEAHRADIVHRDLKPENLFVARRADGSELVKVVDFGISKNLGKETQGRALTNPSTAVGSPQYMAPEQMQARGVDVRADIWALGVILYELLSGRQAFEGETLPEVCAKVLGQEPPNLRSVRGDVPESLERIVTRCLSKVPDGRYANVGQFAQELAPFGSQQAQTSLQRIGRVLSGGLPTGGNWAAPALGQAQTVLTPAQGTQGFEGPPPGVSATLAADAATGGTQSAWLATAAHEVPKSGG